ncbi:hypothetical protein [Clostridium sp.]|uniref:hypothetical protein n=1 Tax=Clostridium sp. TaxID=1506 RepID=UPI0025C0CC14|nr:hypothetical protein [Clostridium sp.]
MKYILPLPNWEKYEGYEMGMINNSNIYKVLTESPSMYIFINDLGIKHSIPKIHEGEYYRIIDFKELDK